MAEVHRSQVCPIHSTYIGRRRRTLTRTTDAHDIVVALPTAAAIAGALALLLGVSLETAAAHTTASASASPERVPAATASQPLSEPLFTSAPVAVPSALTDDEEGYTSDGSMPGLQTPTGSSDDDYDHI